MKCSVGCYWNVGAKANVKDVEQVCNSLPDFRLTLSSLSLLCSHSSVVDDDSTHHLIKRPFISNHSRTTHEMETVVRARLDIDVMSQKCSDYLLMIIYAIAMGRAQKNPHWLKVRVVRLWSDCVKFEIQLIDWLGSQAVRATTADEIIDIRHRSRVFVSLRLAWPLVSFSCFM